MTDKPNCYQCIYRGEVPGSAHSCCEHPQVSGGNDPLIGALAILASVGRIGPVVDQGGAEALNIRANPHGIRRGWFNWPYNFDPTWLESCDGFTPRAEKPAVVETRIE